MHTQSKFRVLVVRLGAMGDILHALPAATALRQAHPSWVIDWVVEPAWRALLTAREGGSKPDRSYDQPLVDRVYLAPTKAWGRKPLSASTLNEITALRRELRVPRYDAVVDLQGAVRSAALGWLSGSHRRIGESRPREWAARWMFTERVEHHGRHVIEQDVEVASAVAGDELKPVLPWLPVCAAAEIWCDTLLANSSGPIALLNPGAGWGSKRWPAERYGEVALGLSRRGFRVLINVGPGEDELAESVRIASGRTAFSVHCSLAELIALSRRIAVLVAGDTGPLHLACALGRPVVGIFGPTDPARNGPFGTAFRVLRSPISQRDHARTEAPEAGLLTIAPHQVLEAVDELTLPQEEP